MQKSLTLTTATSPDTHAWKLAKTVYRPRPRQLDLDVHYAVPLIGLPSPEQFSVGWPLRCLWPAPGANRPARGG